MISCTVSISNWQRSKCTVSISIWQKSRHRCTIPVLARWDGLYQGWGLEDLKLISRRDAIAVCGAYVWERQMCSWLLCDLLTRGHHGFWNRKDNSQQAPERGERSLMWNSQVDEVQTDTPGLHPGAHSIDMAARIKERSHKTCCWGPGKGPAADGWLSLSACISDVEVSLCKWAHCGPTVKVRLLFVVVRWLGPVSIVPDALDTTRPFQAWYSCKHNWRNFPTLSEQPSSWKWLKSQIQQSKTHSH